MTMLIEVKALSLVIQKKEMGRNLEEEAYYKLLVEQII